MLGFFTDPQLRVVSTCVGHPAGPPLVICHDACLGRHSVWAVQQATSEVGKKHQLPDFHDDETAEVFIVQYMMYYFSCLGVHS